MSAAVPARLSALLQTMVATIREPDARERHAASPAEYFAGRGLEPRDQAALALVDPKALFTYRSLVRGTLRSAIHQEIPRTATLLGDRFEVDLDRYFASSMPSSHYLRDVAFEFVELASAGWRADAGVPPFAHDLARHELLDFEVAASPRAPRAGAPPAEAALELERPVLFDGAARLARYDYPVHTIAAEGAVAPRETWLFVYRDSELEIRHLELTPLAAAITRGLLDGEPLGRAVTVACEKLRATLSAATLEGVAKLLADYAERGVLIGSLTGSLPDNPS